MVERRLFRADLYYRLSGVEIHVPPLRDAAGRHPRARAAIPRPAPLDAAARAVAERRDALRAYDWPGNVRELERVIERAVALAGADASSSTTCRRRCAGRYADVLLPSHRAPARRCARGAAAMRGSCCERCDDNKRRACRVLGISYHTLQAYLRYRDRPAAVGPPRGNRENGASNRGAAGE